MKQFAVTAFALGLFACGGGKSGGDDGATTDGGDGIGSSFNDPVCGNGKLEQGEDCDDGNTASGDGCSATCMIETGFACGDPGNPCVANHTCGNGIVEPTEGCDDHNKTAGDGCDANCALEPGWTCPVAGIRCKAAACGDGIIAGTETCDDGNTTSGDGCSSNCALEAGFKCVTANTACVAIRCGDGVTEGLEQCDDGNNNLGDGCTPFCTREPECVNGDCTAVCGDGVLQAGEACDDGNTANFDGCSSTCTVETGFYCTATSSAEPATLPTVIVYRDFKGFYNPGTSVAQTGGHYDFEHFNGDDRGMLATTMANHKPVYAKATGGTSTTQNAASFNQWYNDDATVNQSFPDHLTLTKSGTSTYMFASTSFFPLDSRGWVTAATNPEPKFNGHNFSFTSELRYWFQFKGTEDLKFYGDDDVWVFINDKLALDLGGVHGQESGEVNLATTSMGLVVGKTYEVTVLQAERHTSASNYELTLQGFNASHSACDDMCGDGITSTNEACDDGINMGGYNSCTPDCLGFGPRCGDGIVQSQYEQCDDGTNTGGYGHCNPDCTLGPRCGDGIVQSDHGEACDDGNDNPFDGCDMCQIPIE